MIGLSFFVIPLLLKRRTNLIFLYEHGLIEKRGGDPGVVRWDQIQYLKHSCITDYHSNMGPVSRRPLYIIQMTDNVQITFDNKIDEHYHLFNRIKQKTVPYLLSQARKRYHEGQEVFFGQLAISSTGIHNTYNRSKTLSWSEVAYVKLSPYDDIKIKQKGSQWDWFNAQISNAEVFQRMTQEILEEQEKTARSGSPHAPVPGRPPLAQRYDIVERAGQGGYGIVYKASDRQRKNMLVAIKQIDLNVLSPREMIEATDSYNREVQHLSKLEHKNLPRIYDHFTDPQHWYVVMDYIEGETLEDYLAANHVPPATVIEIGITLCSVLDYLHSQYPPIIFRDVKPSNIMCTPTGHLYLIDFGIARRYTPGKHRDTGPLGSPGYAAPEQYGKAQTTVQTDIYGLGVTLQTLLTSKDPLEIAQNGSDELIPEQLRPLLKQMLELDSSKRPQSMNEVKKQLLQLRKRFPRANKVR